MHNLIWLGVGILFGLAFVLTAIKLGVEPMFAAVGLNLVLGLWQFAHGRPLDALYLLGIALQVLFWGTGERGLKYRYPISGPITLAGPVHPWQAQND